MQGVDRERWARIGELKGMVAGLHTFCVAVKVDPAHFMAAWTPLLESIEEHRSVLDDPTIPVDEEIATQIEAVLRLNWPGLMRRARETMNDKTLAKYYDRLTGDERFRLSLEANMREDTRELQRLKDSCPTGLQRHGLGVYRRWNGASCSSIVS
jgi:hypothetical protein